MVEERERGLASYAFLHSPYADRRGEDEGAREERESESKVRNEW